MITGSRMGAVDANAATLGVPRKQLMESSGHAVARAIRDRLEPGSTIVIVAGRGNNGGDAFVAARFLDAYDVRTLLLGTADAIGTEIARANWEALQTSGYHTREVADSTQLALPEGDLFVDAMLGTGIDGELREPAATAARAMNEASAPVLSVDVPSGFDSDTGTHAKNGVEADAIVTFHDTKPGLADLDTDLTVADIGIPPAAERNVGPGDLALARPSARTGRAFVIGGGPYTGAPALAAQAALRAGAELSFVAAPDIIAGEIQGYSEDLIVQPYTGRHLTPEQVPELVDTAERYDDVVVLGPGLGTATATLEAVEAFLESYTGPAVIDADALSVVPELETEADLLCTPNRRELAQMGGPETESLLDAADELETFAGELGHVVLAKGPTDVITDGEQTRFNRAGTPGMAVGGTGDVLAGICAGLFEHNEAFEAAAAGAYINGIAGERASTDTGLGVLASEILEFVPETVWGSQ